MPAVSAALSTDNAFCGAAGDGEEGAVTAVGSGFTAVGFAGVGGVLSAVLTGVFSGFCPLADGSSGAARGLLLVSVPGLFAGSAGDIALRVDEAGF